MTTPKQRPEIGGQALSRRQLADKQAAKRLLRKLLKKQMRMPRFMITDKLASYGACMAPKLSMGYSKPPSRSSRRY
jgi:transposase-like protein